MADNEHDTNTEPQAVSPATIILHPPTVSSYRHSDLDSPHVDGSSTSFNQAANHGTASHTPVPEVVLTGRAETAALLVQNHQTVGNTLNDRPPEHLPLHAASQHNGSRSSLPSGAPKRGPKGSRARCKKAASSALAVIEVIAVTIYKLGKVVACIDSLMQDEDGDPLGIISGGVDGEEDNGGDD